LGGLGGGWRGGKGKGKMRQGGGTAVTRRWRGGGWEEQEKVRTVLEGVIRGAIERRKAGAGGGRGGSGGGGWGQGSGHKPEKNLYRIRGRVTNRGSWEASDRLSPHAVTRAPIWVSMEEDEIVGKMVVPSTDIAIELVFLRFLLK